MRARARARRPRVGYAQSKDAGKEKNRERATRAHTASRKNFWLHAILECSNIMRTAYEAGILPSADGSASCTEEDFRIVASVIGQRRLANPRAEDPRRALLDVSVSISPSGKGTLADAQCDVVEELLRSVFGRGGALRLEAYPRCVITIAVRVEAAGAFAAATAVTAASLALLDAGVEMLYAPVAARHDVGDVGSKGNSATAVFSLGDVTSAHAAPLLSFSASGVREGARVLADAAQNACRSASKVFEHSLRARADALC